MALRAGRLTIPGLALIAVCYGLARFAYGLFVPAFRTEFSLSDTLLGAIAALSYVGYCLAIVVAGALVPRLGARAVAGLAGVVATVGMALVAAAPDPGVLAGAVLIAGSSTGLASPPVADALARWLPEAGQNRAQAVANSGTGVGIALSGPVALMAFGGWRWAWLGFAIIAGLVTAWIVLAIPPGVPGAGQRERAGALGVLALVADARSVRLVAAATLFGMATACMWTFGRDHIVSAGGIDETTSTVLWLFLGVAGVIGAAGGDLVTRHGLGATWRACFVIVAVATFSVGAWPGSTAVVAVAMASFGAAYITLTLVVLLWAVRLYPDQVSAGVGCGFLMLALGQAVGAPLAGLLADHLGPGGAFAAFAGLGGLAALAGPRGARGDGRKARTGVSVT